MKRFLAVAAALACLAVRSVAAAPGFGGDWATTYGDMTLTESSASVAGTYMMEGSVCALDGRRGKDGTLTFVYHEPEASGEGRFRLSADGNSFEGEWRAQGSTSYIPWLGRRRQPPEAGVGFGGLWETNFGRLRLTGSGGAVSGYYSFADGTISGRVEGDLLKFRYKDQKEGDGEFRLAQNGRALRGRWRADGDKEWRDWTGMRVDPVAGRKWLVVLESRWESSLAEPEYTYGEMLKIFFARTPNVQVRQRFYTDRSSLLKWMREASLLAEPVVLYFSGHGTSEGLETETGPATAAVLAGPLQAGGNVALVHFGSCDVMKGGVPAELQRLAGAGARFPVSGFAQPVDWAASAVTDFMYLDLILSRDLTPAKAAAELKRLMPFTARENSATAYDGVSFRLLPAPGAPL
jgi:hypothetical protein